MDIDNFVRIFKKYIDSPSRAVLTDLEKTYEAKILSQHTITLDAKILIVRLLLSCKSQKLKEDDICQLLMQTNEDYRILELLGLYYLSTHQFSQALNQFQKVPDQKLNHESLTNIGNCQRRMGQYQQAIKNYTQALKLSENFEPAIEGLLATYFDQSAHAEVSSFLKSIPKPLKKSDLILYHSGLLSLRENDFPRAKKMFEKLENNGKYWPRCLINLAIISEGNNELNEAVEYLNQADVTGFQTPLVRYNLGNVYKKLGQLKIAITKYKSAIDLGFPHHGVWINLGNCFTIMENHLEAEKCFVAALEISPKSQEALFGLAIVYEKMENLEKSRAIYIKLNSDTNSQKLLARQYQLEKKMCLWSAADFWKNKFGIDGKNPDPPSPFSLLSYEDNPNNQLQRSKAWVRSKILNVNMQRIPCRPIKTERIKVGYFGCDFTDHATMYLAEDLFKNHNLELFEVYAFDYGYYDKEKYNCRPEIFRNYFDVSNSSDIEIAYRSRNLGLHIAVDLKGYTGGARPQIFANRCAPLQINFLGYPGSLGAEYIDYMVADATIIPKELRKNYLEKIIFMPNSYQPNSNSTREFKKDKRRLDFGFTDDQFIFCCFNNNYKITQKEVEIWVKLLKEVDESILWILRSNPEMEKNLSLYFGDQGINKRKIAFSNKCGYHDYLERLRHADLFLDCFNVNAHTTASDALSVGLPVITKMGKQFPSRVCGSILRAMSMDNLIVDDYESYFELAKTLATNRDTYESVRSRLKLNKFSTPLFDIEKYTRDFEKALETIYERYLNDDRPCDIYV